MELRTLGRTDLKVTAIGLGTMTWGQQNTESQAHEQMDYAVGQGVSFFDAAEMYPVPPKAETQGRTEQYIGTWLKKSGKRRQLTLSSKVTGPGDFSYLRGGARLDKKSVIAACEGSLRRLQTDVIDLYHVHWPERGTNYFGRLGYEHRDSGHAIPIEDTLDGLATLVRDGKVRHVAASNETPWGLAEYLRCSREYKLPRIAAVQNPYSLLNRSFEVGLAEFVHREQVSLLAYSPLAFGMLSGKYLDGARPPDSRVTMFARFSRYSGEPAQAAAAEYVALARKHGLDPAQMALAYVQSRSFVASALIGATTMEQLRSNLASAAIKLSKELLQELEQIHKRHTYPAP